MNFDETTRLLSDRLLDRTHLIVMRSDKLPAIRHLGPSEAWPLCEGRRVVLQDFRAWTRDAALPTTLAAFVDRLRQPLGVLGSPLTPRGYRAICRFVASCGELLSPEAALDVAITQRLLSKIRNVTADVHLRALDELVGLVGEGDPCALYESQAVLEDIRRREVLLDALG